MAIVDLRYARALAQVVQEQKLDVNAVQAQLSDFAGLVEGNRDLREVLQNPSIPEQQKLNLLDSLAGRLGMSKPVRNLLAVMMHNNRLHELGEIVAAYHEIADEETRVAEAEITTARPLDPNSKALLEQQVAKLAGGQQVRASYSEDASLLGGAVVRIGTTVYDGSVRAQLEALKQRLMAAHA